jgi:cyclophilin family peptidyl-prolyl cis-trans isomerase
MISKYWFCGLLTAVVLVCGCGEGAKKANLERTMMTSETKTVKLETSMGNIIIELNEQAAPVTVKNFLGYVNEGFFDGTIFHRVIPNFMIQGGGFTDQMVEKQRRTPIVNEAKNGLKNERGTIAMARTNDPDSATCQFFINHKDNDFLNYVENGNPGYAVFGKIIEGMDVVDAIASVNTTTRMGYNNVPVNPVEIKSARVVSQ